MHLTNYQKGFTLIELLVVIAIIGLIASVALVAMNTARTKARDAKKIADFKQISTALYLFFNANNRMPNNYNPGSGACEPSTYYNQSIQELVSEGLIAKIPYSPGGGGYCYYNYGSGNTVGALIVTTLEAAPDTTTGIPPSCRPWGTTNWCNSLSNKYYCICNPY